MTERPMPGELYRHFKDKLYQIVTVAKHSETGEELVIYQALYGDYAVYARPLAMFTSEVDHRKYPEVSQRYRFERVEAREQAEKKERMLEEGPAECGQKPQEPVEEVGGIDPNVMAFLEADSFEERCKILVSVRDDITDAMIDTMAVAVDEVIPAGPLQKRYDDLLYVLRTKRQYESANRLRS